MKSCVETESDECPEFSLAQYTLVVYVSGDVGTQAHRIPMLLTSSWPVQARFSPFSFLSTNPLHAVLARPLVRRFAGTALRGRHAVRQLSKCSF
jgi:hypothetical protein